MLSSMKTLRLAIFSLAIAALSSFVLSSGAQAGTNGLAVSELAAPGGLTTASISDAVLLHVLPTAPDAIQSAETEKRCPSKHRETPSNCHLDGSVVALVSRFDDSLGRELLPSVTTAHCERCFLPASWQIGFTVKARTKPDINGFHSIYAISSRMRN